MGVRTAENYLAVADAAWRWVLDQVRWDDGPWIPESVDDAPVPPRYRDGFHSGIGGLAHVLAEIRLDREWTAEEERLAAAVADRLRGRIADEVDYSFFVGLVSTINVLTVLGEVGAQAAVDRLLALATPDGWHHPLLGDARGNDLALGTAGVLLGAVWARRAGLDRAQELGELAADVLVAEAETTPAGLNWLCVPRRFRTDVDAQMPNLTHGLAGIATAVALAGFEFGRPDLTRVAVRGAEHLVSLGRTDGNGFVVPVHVPGEQDTEGKVSYGWCHGAAGTSLLFLALHLAGVESVSEIPPLAWHRRCLHSVRTSGLPARLYPGFWDNDGRCCGTAGVGDIFLNAWHHFDCADDLEFALRLADTVVERTILDGPHAYWRFTEHRLPDPLLPPRVGWTQGAAGIAAFLFHAARVLRHGRAAAAVFRMDTWWTLPQQPR